MRDRKLATRYARALLGALSDPTDRQTADAFLEALSASLESSAELRRFLLDPATPSKSKKAVLDQLAATQRLPAGLVTFLGLLVDKGRLGAVTSIAEVFHLEREAAQGEVSATLLTAAPLTPELRARAASALEKLSGRRVNLAVEVDPSILGGAVARIGSMIYDGSLKTQLDRLRRTMGES